MTVIDRSEWEEQSDYQIDGSDWIDALQAIVKDLRAWHPIESIESRAKFDIWRKAIFLQADLIFLGLSSQTYDTGIDYGGSMIRGFNETFYVKNSDFSPLFFEDL